MDFLNDNEYLSITSNKAKYRIVCLHGWGADAEDLIGLGKEIISLYNKPLEIISLRAPSLRDQNMGRQWYKLFPSDWNEAKNSVDNLIVRLNSLSKEQFKLEDTFLLGFSQGGAMAITAGYKLPLAGIITCSGYPHPNWIPDKNPIPLLITHGKYDDVVPLKAFYKLCNLVENENTHKHIFDGSHEIDKSTIYKIIEFLKINT